MELLHDNVFHVHVICKRPMLISSQSAPLPRLLPSSLANDDPRSQRSQSSHTPNCAGCDRTVHPPCLHHRYTLSLFHLCSTTESTRMGQFSRNIRNSPRIHTILPTDIYHIHAEEGGQLEHTHDAHTNSRKLCLGCQSCCQSWQRRLEYLGSLPGHRVPSRNPAGHGNHLRATRTTKGKGWRDTDRGRCSRRSRSSRVHI